MRGRKSRAELQMITGASCKLPLFGADRLHGQRLTQRVTALRFCLLSLTASLHVLCSWTATLDRSINLSRLLFFDTGLSSF